MCSDQQTPAHAAVKATGQQLCARALRGSEAQPLSQLRGWRVDSSELLVDSLELLQTRAKS